MALGYIFGSRFLVAEGQFGSSHSYCYFNLFDMTKYLPDAKGNSKVRYSGDSFQVGITAWVNWGEVLYQKGSEPTGTPDKYHLVDRGWSSASLTFTVYA
jgi:hypothetical protein